MTSPAAWLDPDAVTRWVTSSGSAALPDADDLARVCAATAVFVEAARPDQLAADPPTYSPDAEVLQAAIMLAARTIRRRNSPGGIEQFGVDGLVSYVARTDPDVERALRLGAWSRPVVG